MRRCLLALEGQGADQVVVSRSSEAEFSESLVASFPQAVWIEKGGAPDLPELQWLALPQVRCDVAAFLEAPSIPGPGWVAAHRQAHLTHPEMLVCGGPVRPAPGANAGALGWYWSDYAAYTPGRPSGPTRDLTDANVSYKARELRENESLLTEAAWGWRMREASAETSYYEASAWLDYPCPFPLMAALGERWSAGRAHGAIPRHGVPGRVISIATAPLLPVVLAWRGWRQAQGAQGGLSYLRALPWILAFHICWTCGELTGILAARR